MKLPDSTYEEIKMEVTYLFEELDIRCIPISGFEILQKMGIKLIPYSSFQKQKREILLKKFPDAFFTDFIGEEAIVYNDEISYPRLNMTLLHEIGHIVLGHTNEMNEDKQEAEAKFFAKYALAPPPLVHLLKPNSPMEIMELFQISYEAAQIAYTNYLKWRKKKHQEMKLTPYEKALFKRFKEPYHEAVIARDCARYLSAVADFS